MVFTTNNEIISGLPDVGSYSKPCCFVIDGSYYIFEGANKLFFKYNEITEEWESDSTINNFDVNPFTGNVPGVLNYNGELYLFLFGWTSVTGAYRWSSSIGQWQSTPAMLNGYSLNSKRYGCPSFLYLDSDLYMILSYDGYDIDAWKWNGSQWVSDTYILSGLSLTSGSNANVCAFWSNGELYLIKTSSLPQVFVKWNSSSAQWENSENIGLVNAQRGFYTFLEKDGLEYLLYGKSDGLFGGLNVLPPLNPPKISSVSIETENGSDRYLTIVLLSAKASSEEIKAYIDIDCTALNANYPSNEIILTTTDDITFVALLNIEEGDTYCIKAEQYDNGYLRDDDTISGSYYVFPQKSETIVNITNPSDYVVLDDPQHPYNHGLLYYNGYIYGSARGKVIASDNSIVKIRTTDYSEVYRTKIYLNKTASINQIFGYDQIVECMGFIWSSINDYLVRINTSDLDYMIFTNPSLDADYSQPIGTDGVYLYVPGTLAVTKLDAAELIGSFASYGYTGDSPVSLPEISIIGTCSIIQHHPTQLAHCHSIAIDHTYLYLAITTTVNTPPTNSGYDSELEIYYCHLQKINKNTMSTAGDVIIPKSTDDMTQNAEYVFLAPELDSYYEGELGRYWGAFAVNKETLEIKYLKALYGGVMVTEESPSTRSCYGCFYYGDKVVVQIVGLATTVVLDTSEIERWGDDFYIGEATEAIYKFQINGVNTYPCNEFVLDNDGNVHINTWQEDTIIFKFPSSTIPEIQKTPIIQTILAGSSANNVDVEGFIIEEGMSEMTVVGFVYGTDMGNLENTIVVTPVAYDFQSEINNLNPGIYFIRAYGTNNEGTFYGNTVVFTTFNVMDLSNTLSSAVLDWIADRNGCTVRCVQDAPGIADGVTGTINDIDGNVYDTIVINEKRWLVQNLKVTKYANGDPIPRLQDSDDWSSSDSGAYCRYID